MMDTRLSLAGPSQPSPLIAHTPCFFSYLPPLLASAPPSSSLPPKLTPTDRDPLQERALQLTLWCSLLGTTPLVSEDSCPEGFVAACCGESLSHEGWDWGS